MLLLTTDSLLICTRWPDSNTVIINRVKYPFKVHMYIYEE